MDGEVHMNRIRVLSALEKPLHADPRYLDQQPHANHKLSERHRERVIKYINEVRRVLAARAAGASRRSSSARAHRPTTTTARA